ncbi:MAG: carbamoyltransferase [Magnetococcales bacterium]|nr:carbamoyltransferase [Magnetococcales bacterium]
MSGYILGISAYYHDSSAALVRDGEVIAAAQEERFTRVKHDPRFPRNAINYCLEAAFIEAEDLRAVVFYDDTLLTLDRVLKTTLATAPRGRDNWRKAARSLLGIKVHAARRIRDYLQVPVPVLFTRHHDAHMASAFYPSPFDEAAILTLDGVGEWATTNLGHGVDGAIRILEQIDFPHSLGLLYSAFTVFCGFKVNSGEYKLMGLAPYGTPRYADLIRRELIDIREDGSFRLNMRHFGYLDTLCMTGDAFEKLFGGPALPPDGRITRREMDLAASIQQVTEEVVLACAKHLRRLTGSRNLVMAGGVALNCVANGRLLRSGLFENLWIQPAAGDAGGALGAALLAAHRHFGLPRAPRPSGQSDRQRASLLGPSFSEAEIHAFLDINQLPFTHLPDPGQRAALIADHLAAGKVVGFFNGPMEFGPRALGGRSILGDPRNPETQTVMNLKIKQRESFRPFAPAVLESACGTWFELDRASPYMLLVADVRAERRLPITKTSADTDDLLEVVRQPRSDIPAVTHMDYSARVQTVNPADNPEFHRVISAFEARTGVGVVVNTSFNVRGEPIVCSPKDAYRCFMRTDMDLLVMGSYVLCKKGQPERQAERARQERFAPD